MARKKRHPTAAFVRFPVLTGLHVEGYGLFPGNRGKGLKAVFPSGLTVVLGANGLGKTTLVWIMYRLLSGPYDIPGLDDGGDLGGRSLEPRPVRDAQRKRLYPELRATSSSDCVDDAKPSPDPAKLEPPTCMASSENRVEMF